MSSGMTEIRQQADGSLKLTWPQARKTDRYLLQIYKDSGEEAPDVYVNAVVADNFYILPQLPEDLDLTISIHTVVDYKLLWMEKERLGREPLQIVSRISLPKAEDLVWQADPDSKTVTLSYSLGEQEYCKLYVRSQEEAWTEILETKDSSIVLDFGPQGDFKVPAYAEQAQFAVSLYRKQTGITIHGEISGELSVEREDLLGRDFNLVFTDEGYNVCSLSWDETKGDSYQVQMLDAQTDTWITLAQIPHDGERYYTSPHMPANKTYTYRVVAVGGQVAQDSDYAAISESVEQKTVESPVFCTVWPTREMPAYTSPEKLEKTGIVQAGSAWCVLEETDGMFAIRLNGEICYIESNFCMINLPEHLGQLCSYDITNSYASLYMVHEFAIPEVTDVVTAGYEQVKLDSGAYLVPVLYPTAQRLADAARTALEQGYRLKIYDAFRPRKATTEIYELTQKILDTPLPEQPFTDKKTLEELALPEPKPELNPQTGELEDIPLTYADVMVNEEYGLSHFLALGRSMHNYGLALDLTIVDLQTGEELQMQTSMHDLSRYSVLDENNENADVLKAIMISAGFEGLVSEWWHYQDNIARDELDTYALEQGVAAACWMADDNGWRYRKASGNYYTDCQAVIDGVYYTFDAQGYVVR